MEATPRLEHHEVLIVGAGPAGLTAALFARNRGLDVIALEGAVAGGQLQTVYPHKPVYNYPGSLGVPAGDLAKRMVDEVIARGITIRESSAVEAIEPLDGMFRLRTRGALFSGTVVLIASGLGLFEPRRLGVSGEQEATGSTLFYTVSDPAGWACLRVAVIGGGDSAVDNALLLKRKGARVTLVHRGTELRAQEQSVRELRSEGGEVWLGRAVDSFAVRGGALQINLGGETGQRACLFDRVLVNAGVVARSAFLDSLPVARVKGRVRVDTEMRVTLPGVFACGDVADYPGKARLIVTAMGEAATAIGTVERYLKLGGSAAGEANVDVGARHGVPGHGG